jgi:hypothetical protein
MWLDQEGAANEAVPGWSGDLLHGIQRDMGSVGRHGWTLDIDSEKVHSILLLCCVEQLKASVQGQGGTQSHEVYGKERNIWGGDEDCTHVPWIADDCSTLEDYY